MKTQSSLAAVLGLVGGMVLGMSIGIEMSASRDAAQALVATVQAVAAPAPEPVRATPRRIARVSRLVTPANPPKLVMTIPVSSPELQDRLKPVLARGTKMLIAVEGFSDAAQFATIAHAARNTQVPFILLKHRVLNEGQSLEAAIRTSKPGLDAAAEVARARSEARGDIAALSATD